MSVRRLKYKTDHSPIERKRLMFLVEKPVNLDSPSKDFTRNLVGILLGTEFAFTVHSAETRCIKWASQIVWFHIRPKQLLRLCRKQPVSCKTKILLLLRLNLVMGSWKLNPCETMVTLRDPGVKHLLIYSLTRIACKIIIITTSVSAPEGFAHPSVI